MPNPTQTLKSQLAQARQRIAELEAREAEHQRSEQMQGALYRIADAASAAQDMPEFYAAIHQIVGELMVAKNFYIALYDHSQQMINFPYYVDEVDPDIPDPKLWEKMGLGEARGLTSYVIRTERSGLFFQSDQDELARRGEIEIIGARSAYWLGVPLKTEEGTIGVLVVQSYSQDVTYSDQDVTLLNFVGQHIATALERASLQAETRRLLKVTEERNAELAIINSVQAGLVAELNMTAIYELVGDKIRDIFDAQVVDIGLYNTEDQLIHFPYTIERGVRFPDEPIPLIGYRKHVMETGQALLINENALEAAARYGNPVVIQGEVPKANLFVPMIVGSEAKGVISLQNLDREQAFSDSDVRLLTTLANSMSIALENARLFAETQRLLKVTEERNAELAIINSVQAGLVAELDIQTIYDLVGDEIRNIFDAQVLMICTFDREAHMEQFNYYIEKGERSYPTPRSLDKLRRHLIDTRQQLLINENFVQTLLDFNFVTERIEPVPGTELPKSALFVPLVVGETVRGYVSLQNVDREHAFSDSDVRLLTTLANSMSIALENARLFAETQRLLKVTEERNAELAIINSISEGLVKQLDFQAIIDLVGDKIRDVFAAQVVTISLFHPQTNLIHHRYMVERDQRFFFDEPQSVDPDRLEIIETRQPLLFGTSQEMIAHSGADVLAGEMPESFLGVPIILGAQVTGVITVQDLDRQYLFGESDVRLLSTLAANMGVALENARLFDETTRLLQETRQRTAELATINTVSQAIATELDLTTLIELVGQQIRQAFQADIAYVALLDRQSKLINFPYVYGEDLAAMPYGEGLTSKIIQTGQALLINEDVDKQTTALGATNVGVQSESYLGVPIYVSREAIGVLSVQSTRQRGRFAEADLRLLETIAANVGAALQNAQLYQETQRRANEMAALTEVGREISATLDPDVVLERIAAHARELLHAKHSAVFLPESGGQTFKASVAQGEIAPQLKAMTVRLDKGIIGDVARRGQAEIVNNAKNDPRVIHIDGTPVDDEEEHLLVTPLLSGQQVSGIMVVWRTGAGFAFVESELTFLIGLARQAAIAITNARLFEEAAAARAEAEQANQAKSAFLATMSHELRTPLNAIIGFTKIVKRKATGVLPDKQVDNLDKVMVSAEHLLGLINTILDIAKIEAGRMEVTPGEFDVAKLVEMCAVTAQPLFRTGVGLGKDIEPDLPLAYSDQDKIKQILLNLLSNAAKFTHQGEVVVSASLRGDGGKMAAGEKNIQPSSFILHISVKDSGIGMNEEALGRVFEEFQQADNSTTRQYGGTGLGLSISRKLAQLLGGDLTATSEEGAGSTFTLTVPLRYGDAGLPQTPVPAAENPRIDAPTAVGAGAAGSLILAIDDDPNAIYLLQENLSEAGYRVVGVRDSNEGLRLARELRPVAITLDIVMPHKDGWQVLHDLKTDPATRDIPVIVLTIVDKKALGMQLGAVDYLVKPLSSEMLLATLAKLTTPDQRQLRLLVVDDDPDVGDMVTQVLENQPYAVTCAPDGLAALEAISRQTPDAILLDLTMPRLDGFGVIERLQRQAHTRAIPVIVLTAKTLTRQETALLQQSVSQVIQKQGLAGETLIEQLQTVLQKVGSTGTPPVPTGGTSQS